jgi:hypothetical protein
MSEKKEDVRESEHSGSSQQNIAKESEESADRSQVSTLTTNASDSQITISQIMLLLQENTSQEIPQTANNWSFGTQNYPNVEITNTDMHNAIKFADKCSKEYYDKK